VNDLSVVTAAWAPGANNYRASVETMDQRNALGRAFNGMTVLLGYEIPLRRIGAGLFPANEDFQPSPFSQTSAEDLRFAFEGAVDVYRRAGLETLLHETDPELEAKVADGFAAATAAIAELNAPYERFLAPPAGSAGRLAAEAAVKALTNLARDLRQAGNRLGILVVVPGM
jgi:putative iron-regulated protein